MREGRHRLETLDGRLVARARLVNVFTRYDTDPARRRVTTFPSEMGLGTPSRISEFPSVDALLPAGRRADFGAPFVGVAIDF